MCGMHLLYSTWKEKPVDIISTQHRKKIHGSQGSTHMLKGKHVYNTCIVRSLQRENSCFRVKIGHPFKVKFTCHRGKTILPIIFGITEFSMIACPFLLIPKKYFLKIAVVFAFPVHGLFHQFILAFHLPLRNIRLSVFFVPKVPLAQHRVFNGVYCKREEYVIQVTGSNPSFSTFSYFTGINSLGHS